MKRMFLIIALTLLFVPAAFAQNHGEIGILSIIGLRFDVGDEIYFQDGTHHNLRVAFGPHIRF